MGLCKCEKRKVTTLFCFEHQVNVCEHCLLAEHSRVRLYLLLQPVRAFFTERLSVRRQLLSARLTLVLTFVLVLVL